jgi:hypothetical protein
VTNDTIQGWIILRTSGARTLRLLRSLAEDGYEVWSPVKTESRRKPRANARVDIEVPVTAGFIFARLRHLVDLLDLAAMPEKPRRGPGGSKPAHIRFSVFHDQRGVPIVTERELDRFREHLSRQPKPSKWFLRGDKVRASDGSFGGLQGAVVRSKKGETVVDFGGFLGHVKISTFILQPIEADSCARSAARDAECSRPANGVRASLGKGVRDGRLSGSHPHQLRRASDRTGCGPLERKCPNKGVA